MLAALRIATASCHAELEQVMGLHSDHLTPARYGRAIQVLLAVRTGWEPELEALHPGSTGQHCLWLSDDLARLGLRPLRPAAPLGLDTSQAWGLRYVLEGSALGGRVLLRRMEPFGLTAMNGARYFAGRGQDTGPSWKAFLAQLHLAATPTTTPGITNGAVRAFEALIRHASAHLDEGLDAR